MLTYSLLWLNQFPTSLSNHFYNFKISWMDSANKCILFVRISKKYEFFRYLWIKLKFIIRGPPSPQLIRFISVDHWVINPNDKFHYPRPSQAAWSEVRTHLTISYNLQSKLPLLICKIRLCLINFKQNSFIKNINFSKPNVHWSALS